MNNNVIDKGSHNSNDNVGTGGASRKLPSWLKELWWIDPLISHPTINLRIFPSFHSNIIGNLDNSNNTTPRKVAGNTRGAIGNRNKDDDAGADNSSSKSSPNQGSLVKLSNSNNNKQQQLIIPRSRKKKSPSAILLGPSSSILKKHFSVLGIKESDIDVGGTNLILPSMSINNAATLASSKYHNIFHQSIKNAGGEGGNLSPISFVSDQINGGLFEDGASAAILEALHLEVDLDNLKIFDGNWELPLELFESIPDSC